MIHNPKPLPELSDPFAVVLAALNKHQARYLVIAGQACLFYGVVEHTRDGDLWLETSAENLRRVRRALKEVDAVPRFLPPLHKKYLQRGHAAHFTLTVEGYDFRIDLMGHPPRVDDFEQAWEDAEDGEIHGVACKIVDVGRLVDMKKTQRDRDYEVIARLSAQAFHYADHHPEARDDLGPWLAQELRSPELLTAMAVRWPQGRELLRNAGRKVCDLAVEAHHENDEDLEESIHRALEEEAQQYKAQDRAYWRKRLADIRKLSQRRARGQNP